MMATDLMLFSVIAMRLCENVVDEMSLVSHRGGETPLEIRHLRV
jgi:hypothetical protein